MIFGTFEQIAKNLPFELSLPNLGHCSSRRELSTDHNLFAVDDGLLQNARPSFRIPKRNIFSIELGPGKFDNSVAPDELYRPAKLQLIPQWQFPEVEA
jgi:hypothetical protein